MVIKEWAHKVVPPPLRRFVRTAPLLRGFTRRYKQHVFKRALSQFSDLPNDAPIPTAVLSGLVYGWDNPCSAQREYIEAFLRYARVTDGPILECGSGLSTILLGIVAERNGNEVWSLEHEPFWADKLHSILKKHGIKSVELCVADLRNFGPYSWYDPPKERMPRDFSLVVCDGPPHSTPGGRYGMLPMMRSHLKPGCVVLLDDAGRTEEREIAARWAAELGTSYKVLGSEKPFAATYVPETKDQVESK